MKERCKAKAKAKAKAKEKSKSNPDVFLWFRCVFFRFWPISFSVLVWPLFPFFKSGQAANTLTITVLR
jgi:hypothetical protein